MNYNRVIPRDLFNEAKLLKCLGQLSLLVHDNVKGVQELITLNLENEKQGFEIVQNELSGALFCSNFHCFDNCGVPIYLSTPLNSKAPYPLWFEQTVGDALFNDLVFDDKGAYSEAFLDMLGINKGGE